MFFLNSGIQSTGFHIRSKCIFVFCFFALVCNVKVIVLVNVGHKYGNRVILAPLYQGRNVVMGCFVGWLTSWGVGWFLGPTTWMCLAECLRWTFQSACKFVWALWQDLQVQYSSHVGVDRGGRMHQRCAHRGTHSCRPWRSETYRVRVSRRATSFL